MNDRRRAPRVGVAVGVLALDEYFKVPVVPGPGDKVVADGVYRFWGGVTSNFAVSAARLGATVAALGCAGPDELAREGLAALADEGVDISLMHIVDWPGALARCQVLVDEHGERAVIVIEPDDRRRVRGEVAEALGELSAADVVYLGIVDEEFDVLKEAASHPGRLLAATLETSSLPRLQLQELNGIDILFCSSEAFDAANLELPAPLADQVGSLVVTRGRHGSEIWVDGVLRHHAAGVTLATAPVDTTGAGDCFAAAYVVGVAEGLEGVDLLRWANMAAALSVQRFGPQTGPERAEVLAALGRAGEESVAEDS